jgi:glycosyltransferase involved in cell wall biosynthesis
MTKPCALSTPPRPAVSNPSSPAFSVVVPAHNSAAFLGEALEAVLAQTLQDFELIIVDDGSTDDTWEVIQAWKVRFGSRLVAILNPENRGPAGARNIGIRKAKGDFLAFLDSDDLWVPEHLAHAYEAFQRHGEKAGAFVGQGDLGKGRLYHSIRNFTWPAPELGEASSQLLQGCYFPLPSLCVRRKLLLELGGFREELVCNEDWLLYLLLWKKSLFVHSPTVECLIRRREQSASASGAQMSKAMYRDWIKAYLAAEQSGVLGSTDLRTIRESCIKGRVKELADYLCGWQFARARWMTGPMLETGLAGRKVWIPIFLRGAGQFVLRGFRKGTRKLGLCG